VQLVAKRHIAIDLAEPDVDVGRLLKQRSDDLSSFNRYFRSFAIDDLPPSVAPAPALEDAYVKFGK
jgi:hypothetical protein